MRTKNSNNKFILLQQFSLLLMVLFILVSPCSVKSQIKSLAGFPTQTEFKSFSKTSQETYKSAELCVLTNENFVEANSNSTELIQSSILPLFLSAISFVCFLHLRTQRKKTSSVYEKLSILPALPLFMQYRQLII